MGYDSVMNNNLRGFSACRYDSYDVYDESEACKSVIPNQYFLHRHKCTAGGFCGV